MQFKEMISKNARYITIGVLILFAIFLGIQTCRGEVGPGAAVPIAFASLALLSIFLLLFFKNSSIFYIFYQHFLQN